MNSASGAAYSAGKFSTQRRKDAKPQGISRFAPIASSRPGVNSFIDDAAPDGALDFFNSGCYKYASPADFATPLAHGVKVAASGVMPGKFFLPPFPSGGMPGRAQPDRSRSKTLKSGISLYWETISQYNKMISSYWEMISQYNKMVSQYWEMILQYDKMSSLYWEKVSPYWERISQYNKMVSSYWEVILQHDKMVSLYWERVSTYWEMISQYKEMAGLPSFSGLF